MSSCDAPGLLPLEQAREKLFQAIKPIQQTETSPVTSALDRILARDVISAINVPADDNSAMDGYALRAQDLADSNTLQLIGSSFAGHPFDGKVGPGQCIRIMTGAPIPKGADAVMMQENTSADEQTITFHQSLKVGQAIRPAGQDIQQGQIVLKQGQKISAIHIGLLASLGIAEVQVYRRPKVALFSTGDELKQPGEALAQGDIYDSNRPALRAMLQKLNVEILDYGVIADDKQQLTDTFVQADQQADIVITSGGVSVGEADYTKEMLAQQGQINFWKLAMKPGKPFAFGELQRSYFFGLPGNPVSALVTFHQLALPAIRKLAGETLTDPVILTATSSSHFRKHPGRTDFQRAVYQLDNSGQLTVSSTGNQNSGVLSSVAKANCYLILERERGNVEPGEKVNIQPFDHFFGA